MDRLKDAGTALMLLFLLVVSVVVVIMVFNMVLWLCVNYGMWMAIAVLFLGLWFTAYKVVRADRIAGKSIEWYR